MSRVWAAIVTGVIGIAATFVLPAVAWAEETGVADAVRRRPRIGFFPVLAGLCCLVVVAGVVLVIVLMTRRRR